MKQIRPRDMTQGAFAELLKGAGFEACSKAAVSLAERPKESGVQFTPEARKAAQGLFNSKPRAENRKNGNKTTVWFDDETRAWLEMMAYMKDTSVGELVRRIVKATRDCVQEETKRIAEALLKEHPVDVPAPMEHRPASMFFDTMGMVFAENGILVSAKEKAASAVGATETAG